MTNKNERTEIRISEGAIWVTLDVNKLYVYDDKKEQFLIFSNTSSGIILKNGIVLDNVTIHAIKPSERRFCLQSKKFNIFNIEERYDLQRSDLKNADIKTDMPTSKTHTPNTPNTCLLYTSPSPRD